MENILLITVLLIFAISKLLAQEITLYDKEGAARAYIDYNEESTIFLWNGSPVAFLEKDGEDICVIGYDGNFLGWYKDGIIYNKKGNAVGARKGAVYMTTQVEPVKSIQEIPPIKPISPISPIKPNWSGRWSSITLTELLYSGKN